MIYIASPLIKAGYIYYMPRFEYDLHEDDLSAIIAFLTAQYGAEWVKEQNETDLRNHFYASGYILKFTVKCP